MSFAKRSAQAAIELLAIHQMVDEGATGSELTLPSVAFVESDRPGDPRSDLPWLNDGLIIGRLARKLSGTRSESCIHSAKSWLSYSGIDRSSRCLPWGASESQRKQPARNLLTLPEAVVKVVAALPTQHQQEVILTVPASFDDTARRLTVEAARGGLDRLALLARRAPSGIL